MTALSRHLGPVVLALLGLLSVRIAAAPRTEVSSFTAQSFASIQQAHAGRPFILSFWSVSCEPCRREIAVLADLHRKYPTVPILLVAADPPSVRKDVVRLLGTFALGGIERWQFGDESVERLRYSVDKRWAGELPRTYFFTATHERTAHSGVVDAKWLNDWLAKATESGSAK
ncbi:MAG: TlpA disulfide reductase family protein [Opitutaceae bacterium]